MIIGNSIFFGNTGGSFGPSGDYIYCASPANITTGQFSEQSSFTEAYFSVCSTIGTDAFKSCTNLTKVFFPACETIGAGAFAYCYKLSDYSFPECTTIYEQAFIRCSAMSIAYFPKCTSIAQYSNTSATSVFLNCTNLRILSFPALPLLNRNIFRNYGNITEAYFSACSTIGTDAFYACRNLEKLYLSSINIVTLSNTGALSSTSTALSIYVPASLVNSYKTATNWATYSSRIVAI